MFTRFNSLLGIALVGCVVIGASVPVRGQTANVDISIGGGPVFVDDINGLQAKVDRSGTYTYTISASSSVSFGGATLGFRLYSPDASISVVSHESPGTPVQTPAWQTAWDFTALSLASWDGILPDTFLTGGFVFFSGGFGPTGPTDIVTFTLTFPGVDGIFCVDSTFVPPGGDWLFVGSAGSAVAPSWGDGNGPYSSNGFCVSMFQESAVRIVALDIKPRSCPNPLNVRETGPGAWSILNDQPTDNLGKNTPRALENSKSVVPVAILGSVELDVTDIDISSVALEGVAPVRSSLSDVSSPPADTGPCACSDAGGDGFTDLTLKFDKRALVEALGEVQNRDTVQLTLTGNLLDGTPIEGFDCVLIIGGATAPGVTSDTEDPGLTSFPNPFNPNTKIGFSLAAPSQVMLEIFNVAGQKITTLVDERLDAGRHTVIWNGTTSNGVRVSSGIYFSRLKVDEVFYAKKMLLVK